VEEDQKTVPRETVFLTKVFINRNGLRWCDAPREYCPPKTLCNRWKRRGDTGVLAGMMAGLAPEGTGQKTIRSTQLISRRIAGLRVCGQKGGG
jgi:hypothetical protein